MPWTWILVIVLLLICLAASLVVLVVVPWRETVTSSTRPVSVAHEGQFVLTTVVALLALATLVLALIVMVP